MKSTSAKKYRAVAVAPSESAAANAPLAHPFFVMPVKSALAMQSLEPHETVFDHLVEWQEGMKTIFFSHTWLNFAHPDHDGHKFGLMSELLSRARDGRLHMSTYFKTWVEMGELSPPAKTFQKDVSDGYIWLDFWCIPQAAEAASQRAAAISCITEYISRSSHFIVLAGPWRHGGNGSIRDVHAWGRRGWCRLEQLANALSPSAEPKPIIVAQSPSDVTTHAPTGMGGRSWMSEVVGLGDFTVQDDARQLGEVIRKLVQRRKAVALERGDLLTWRVLHVCLPKLLRGTGADEALPPPEPLDAWMAAMRFGAADEGRRSGLTPLKFAVLAERLDLARDLIARGASVHRRIRKAVPAFELAAGDTILYGALLMRCSLPMAMLLLDAHADPAHKVRGEGNALFAAGLGGSAELIDLLLARRPALWEQTNALGEWPITGALYLGREHATRHLISTCPKFLERLNAPDAIGHTYASWAVMGSADVGCIRALLEAGADPDLVGPNRSAWRLFTWIGSVAFRARGLRQSSVLEVLALLNPAPPLHWSAAFGNRGCVEALLAHGANPNTTTRSKRQTPLHLAALRGHDTVAQILIEAGAEAQPRDKYGRTAADWAAARGHAEMAERLRRAAETVPTYKTK